MTFKTGSRSYLCTVADDDFITQDGGPFKKGCKYASTTDGSIYWFGLKKQFPDFIHCIMLDYKKGLYLVWTTMLIAQDWKVCRTAPRYRKNPFP